MAGGSLDAQTPQPAFRSGVGLVTVEASVLDADGNPVSDLTADDFIVTVSGRPRPVRYLRVHGGSRGTSESAAAAAADAVMVPAAVANRTDDGRIVVFVVDRDSIQPGTERAAFEAASTILDSLGPADASGLFETPGPGLSLTREHQRMKEALRRVTGGRPSKPNWRDRDISWFEALGFERRDPRLVSEVIERECYRVPDAGAGLRNTCPDDLALQAAEMLREGRIRVQTVMTALSSMADQLAGLRGTKQVVFLSAGLPFGQDLLPWFNDFAGKAAAAEIVLSVVHLDPPAVDASARRMATSAFGGREQADGLGAIAGQTGGAFYQTGGSGGGIFTRIETEIGNFYELAVELEAGDAATRSLPIDVKVRRPGLKVRSRRTVVPALRSTASPQDRLIGLLRQPIDIADMPLSVSAYTTRGDDESTLRAVIAAGIGDERFKAPVEWGFAAFSEGNVVATGHQQVEGAAPWPAALSAKLLPGRYRLRVAATDADGRAGVLDLPLTIGLRSAGPLQMSDLMLGVPVNGRLQPQSTIPAGVQLTGYLEVLGADPALLERARTIIEILPAGSAEPVKRFMMAARSGAASTILINQVDLATTGLPPGRYTATAIVTVGEERLGRVSRVFEIVPAK
jgi:VWFA-related protein